MLPLCIVAILFYAEKPASEETGEEVYRYMEIVRNRTYHLCIWHTPTIYFYYYTIPKSHQTTPAPLLPSL